MGWASRRPAAHLGRASRPPGALAGGSSALPGRLPRAGCAPRMGPNVNMGEPGSPIPPFSLGGVPPGGMDGYREHRLLTYAYAALNLPS